MQQLRRANLKMWDFLSKLPSAWSFSLIILLLIALVTIALKGSLKAKFGDKEIDVGGGKHPDDTKVKKPPTSLLSNTALLSIQKRTCGDCILILMGEREKSEFQMRKERDKTLKNQMVFAEQKLIEIQTELMAQWGATVQESIKDKTSIIDETVQVKLINGILKDALLRLKDEIRRSFKDNGFCEFTATEFSEYVKDRIRTLSAMFTQHIRTSYPSHGGGVECNAILEVLDERNPFFSVTVFDIYSHARDIKIEIDSKIESIKNNFIDWVDKFTNKES